MKLQVSIILSALFCLFALVASQNYGQVYCGRRLARTLAYLCDGNLVKRSELWHPYSAADVGWPVVAPQTARSMGRGKRQVVSECCDKPCTLDELYTYCAE